MSDVRYLSGKRDNIPALLHEIAADENVDHIIISMAMKDGVMKFIHVRSTGAEMAFSGAYWLRRAVDDPDE